MAEYTGIKAILSKFRAEHDAHISDHIKTLDVKFTALDSSGNLAGTTTQNNDYVKASYCTTPSFTVPDGYTVIAESLFNDINDSLVLGLYNSFIGCTPGTYTAIVGIHLFNMGAANASATLRLTLLKVS